VLVPLDLKRRRHCIQARRLCHLHIAALGAAGLRLYRNRVDAQYDKAQRDAVKTRNARALRTIVEEAFCSKAAEPALELLGDLAFERGDFDAARRWWRLLAIPVDETSKQARDQLASVEDLVYPDPQNNRVARVRAKQLIARRFQGEGSVLTAAIKTFRALHGKARGHLAGSDGNYADILQKLMETTKVDVLADQDAGTTFAGQPSRNLVLPRPLPGRIAANGAQWSVHLDTGELETRDEAKDRLLD